MGCNCFLVSGNPVLEDALAATGVAAQQVMMAVSLGLLEPEAAMLTVKGDLAIAKVRVGQSRDRFQALVESCDARSKARKDSVPSTRPDCPVEVADAVEAPAEQPADDQERLPNGVRVQLDPSKHSE